MMKVEWPAGGAAGEIEPVDAYEVPRVPLESCSRRGVGKQSPNLLHPPTQDEEDDTRSEVSLLKVKLWLSDPKNDFNSQPSESDEGLSKSDGVFQFGASPLGGSSAQPSPAGSPLHPAVGTPTDKPAPRGDLLHKPETKSHEAEDIHQYMIIRQKKKNKKSLVVPKPPSLQRQLSLPKRLPCVGFHYETKVREFDHEDAPQDGRENKHYIEEPKTEVKAITRKEINERMNEVLDFSLKKSQEVSYLIRSKTKKFNKLTKLQWERKKIEILESIELAKAASAQQLAVPLHPPKELPSQPDGALKPIIGRIKARQKLVEDISKDYKTCIAGIKGFSDEKIPGLSNKSERDRAKDNIIYGLKKKFVNESLKIETPGLEKYFSRIIKIKIPEVMTEQKYQKVFSKIISGLDEKRERPDPAKPRGNVLARFRRVLGPWR